MSTPTPIEGLKLSATTTSFLHDCTIHYIENLEAMIGLCPTFNDGVKRLQRLTITDQGSHGDTRALKVEEAHAVMYALQSHRSRQGRETLLAEAMQVARDGAAAAMGELAADLKRDSTYKEDAEVAVTAGKALAQEWLARRHDIELSLKRTLDGDKVEETATIGNCPKCGVSDVHFIGNVVGKPQYCCRNCMHAWVAE